MPVFLIERTFAEELVVSPEDAANVKRINEESGVQWLISFLSADKKKTYCLYEASNADAIREAAERAGLPADVIIEVGELAPTGVAGEVQKERLTLQ
ncbi:MAG: DUF4242 domain-containing protein [Proteobacteria bacterium]|nr:DUF4242 domain-containing protein [Pseudomonadota bacterium]